MMSKKPENTDDKLSKNLSKRLKNVKSIDEESVMSIVNLLKKHQYVENRSDPVANIKKILNKLAEEEE